MRAIYLVACLFAMSIALTGFSMAYAAPPPTPSTEPVALILQPIANVLAIPAASPLAVFELRSHSEGLPADIVDALALSAAPTGMPIPPQSTAPRTQTPGAFDPIDPGRAG